MGNVYGPKWKIDIGQSLGLDSGSMFNPNQRDIRLMKPKVISDHLHLQFHPPEPPTVSDSVSISNVDEDLFKLPGSGIVDRLSGNRMPFCISSSRLARTEILRSSAKKLHQLS